MSFLIIKIYVYYSNYLCVLPYFVIFSSFFSLLSVSSGTGAFTATGSNPGEGLISPSQDGNPLRSGKEQTEPVDFSQAPGFSPRGFEACFPRGSTVPGDGLSRYRPQNGKIFLY